MTTALTSINLAIPADAPPAARWVFRLMTRLKAGCLEVVTPQGVEFRFGQPSQSPPELTGRIELKNWRVCSLALKSGDIGFAESYMAGDWHTPDLAALLNVFLLNRDHVESVIYGSFWGQFIYRLKHLFNRNTKSQAKKNIHAHYDLGNAFYELWLDPSMTYSSALFAGDIGQSLEAAQMQKIKRLFDWVDGQNLLEIGCVWGGVAEAAVRAGKQITGLTLSPSQLAYAQARLDKLGTETAAKANLKLQDYRDCQGTFDGIVSVEMFEAVGERYWPSFFRCVADRLKPGGKAGIQTIVIAENLFERYRKSTDFIQQYIFPGGMLPTVQRFETEAARQGLTVVSKQHFGGDYALTLRHWRQRFLEKLDQVRAQGFDDRFIRTWEFYLAYCEAGFMRQCTDVVQFYLEKNPDS